MSIERKSAAIWILTVIVGVTYPTWTVFVGAVIVQLVVLYRYDRNRHPEYHLR